MPQQKTGSLEWHGSRWQLRLSVRTAEGKPCRRWVDLGCSAPNTSEGRAQARAIADQVAELASHGVEVADEPSMVETPTLADLAERWFALLDARPGNAKPATIRVRQSRMRCHVLPVLGERTLPIEIPVLRAVFRDLTTQLEPPTVGVVRNVLSTFIDCCQAEGWVAEHPNPCRDRRIREVIPNVQTLDPQDIAALDLDQARALIHCPNVPQDRRDLYLAAIATGLRHGELDGLERGDIDLQGQSPTLRVRQTVDESGRVGTPKTRWSKRTIPIHPTLAARWGTPLVGQPESVAVCARVSASTLREDLETAGVSVPDDFGFHELRHTFATILEVNGTSGDLVDRLLGHAPSTTRTRHYVKPDLARMHEAICRLDLDPHSSSCPTGSASLSTQSEKRRLFQKPTRDQFDPDPPVP